MQLALNRRVSLEGLADGWTDQCFLTFKVANSDEVKEFQKSMDVQELSKGGDKSFDKLLDTLAPRLVSGRVLSTKDDGTTELIDITAKDAREVLQAFPAIQLGEFFQFSLGFTVPLTLK